MRPLIYIQIHQGYFTATRLGRDRTIRKECLGLNHPRTLMGSFDKFQLDLAAVIKELAPRYFPLKPRGLIHLRPTFEGGYTDVELRAFKEAGEMAGINFAFLSTLDRPHTESELAEVLR